MEDNYILVNCEHNIYDNKDYYKAICYVTNNNGLHDIVKVNCTKEQCEVLNANYLFTDIKHYVHLGHNYYGDKERYDIVNL